MRRLLAFAGLLVAGSAIADPASLLIYINPHEYSHDVKLSMQPMLNKWVTRGPLLEAAAQKELAPHFSSVDMCEDNKTADVVASLKPYLSYSALPGTYNAKVSVRFYSADGKFLGRIKASGKQDGPLNTEFADKFTGQAFEDAMKHVAEMFSADQKLQDAIQNASKQDSKAMPCEMVGAIPQR